MLFDDVLCKIGEFGIYQVVLYVLLGLVGIPTGWQHYSIYYIGAYQDHWCKVPRLQNMTFDQQKYLSIPYTRLPNGALGYSSCTMYDMDWTKYRDPELYRWNRTAQLPPDVDIINCSDWTFDTSNVRSTLWSDMKLVCGREHELSAIHMMYACGFMVGSLLFGWISDRCGRHKTLILTLFLEALFGTTAAFLNDLAAFKAMRFLTGCMVAGSFNTAFVMVLEMIGPTRRMGAGVFVQGWLSVGIMVLPGIAYQIREQKRLQCILAMPVTILLIYYWIVPESPRWFATRRRFEDAERVLRRMAAVNGRELPEELELQENQKHDDFERLRRHPFIIDFFTTPHLRSKTCIVFFIWFATSYIYYTLNHHIGRLPGNFYLVGFLSGATEIPGYFFCVLAMNKFGRRWPLVIMYGTCCIVCLICIGFLVDPERATSLTVCAMAGKLVMAAAFASVYVYAAELFPTVVRNSGIGAACMFGSLAAIIAAQVDIKSQESWPPLAMVISSMFSVAAGIAAMLLPETLHHDLPETLVDGENFGANCIQEFVRTGNVHRPFIIPRAPRQKLIFGHLCSLKLGALKAELFHVPDNFE